MDHADRPVIRLTGSGRVELNGTGQRQTVLAPRRRGPATVVGGVGGGGGGRRVRSAGRAVVVAAGVPVVAQRRPRARFHFDVGHVGRHVRVSDGRGVLFVVRAVGLGCSKVGCEYTPTNG